MSANPFSLVSMLLSPVIAFVTASLLVESALAIFKIRQGRLSSILRLLPFITLVIDAVSSSLNVGHWLNPLICDSCLQKLMLTYVFPDLKSYLDSQGMSLMYYLGADLSHNIFEIVFTLFSLTLTYLTVRKLIENFVLYKTVQSMMKHEKLSNRAIENTYLAEALRRNNIKVFASEAIEVPMASYPKAIFMPKTIVENSPQDEFEVILAHELEHLRWKDPVVKGAMQLVTAIFWWVPTTAWMKKQEFDQEIACDRSIERYGFKKEFLASAMLKVAKTSQYTHPAFCYLTKDKHPVLKRMQALLDIPITCSKTYERVSFAIFVIGTLVLVLCAALI